MRTIIDRKIVYEVEQRFLQYRRIENEFMALNYEIMESKSKPFNFKAKMIFYNVIKARIKNLRILLKNGIKKNKRRIENETIFYNEALMSNHYLFFRLNSLKEIESDYECYMRSFKK